MGIHNELINHEFDLLNVNMKRLSEYEKFKLVANELPYPYKLIEPCDYNGYFFDFIPI